MSLLSQRKAEDQEKDRPNGEAKDEDDHEEGGERSMKTMIAERAKEIIEHYHAEAARNARLAREVKEAWEDWDYDSLHSLGVIYPHEAKKMKDWEEFISSTHHLMMPDQANLFDKLLLMMGDRIPREYHYHAGTISIVWEKEKIGKLSLFIYSDGSAYWYFSPSENLGNSQGPESGTGEGFRRWLNLF